MAHLMASNVSQDSPSFLSRLELLCHRLIEMISQLIKEGLGII